MVGLLALACASFGGYTLSMTPTTKVSRLIFICTLSLTGLGPVFAAPLSISFDGNAPSAPAAFEAVTESAPVQPARISGSDVTAEYLTAFAGADAAFKSRIADDLKEYKILLVPGLFSNIDKTRLPLVGRFCSPDAKPRFEEQMAMLKEMGIEFERLEMKSESSIQVDAAIVSAAIKASAKPVIIFGSSKAGLDVLEALVAEKALLAKVRGVIMLQAPFLGTPVVDGLMSPRPADRLISNLLLDLGGSRQSLLDLTVSDREIYMRDNAGAIAGITAAVPVLSVATWMDPAEKGEDTSLKLLRNIMLKRGMKNDGLVPVDSAILPGSDYIMLAGVDHGAATSPTKKIAFDRVNFTKAVLAMILSR